MKGLTIGLSLLAVTSISVSAEEIERHIDATPDSEYIITAVIDTDSPTEINLYWSNEFLVCDTCEVKPISVSELEILTDNPIQN